MEKTINKIMMVSFVGGAALVGYTVQVVSALLSNTWPIYARATDNDMVSGLIPVVAAAFCFFYLFFSKSVRTWAQEVIVEISKVVWPSKKDTTAMTVFVCFFMILTGIILGIFDMISSQIIQTIIDLS